MLLLLNQAITKYKTIHMIKFILSQDIWELLDHKTLQSTKLQPWHMKEYSNYETREWSVFRVFELTVASSVNII